MALFIAIKETVHIVLHTLF